MSLVPARGEVYQVNLTPVKGSEQDKVRPCLVISATGFNDNPLEIAFVVPISSKIKSAVPWHVPFGVEDCSGDLEPGAILCDHLRSVSYAQRFVQPRGWIDNQEVLDRVAERIQVIIGR
jgi:mRNA interferase MazF